MKTMTIKGAAPAAQRPVRHAKTLKAISAAFTGPEERFSDFDSCNPVNRT
jgi:hypothetical protein